jgi:hypothetical protein
VHGRLGCRTLRYLAPLASSLHHHERIPYFHLTFTNEIHFTNPHCFALFYKFNSLLLLESFVSSVPHSLQSTARNMASKYSLIDHDSEEQRIEDPEGPPPVNLFAAANYLNRLFSTNGIHWAAMGGFAMICRGSRRTTHDIDVVTDATMRTLWSVIEPQPR